MTVGVLALQGDVAEHLLMLQKLRTKAKEVRTIDDLAQVDRLIIPGGESTVIGMYLEESGLMTAIQKRVKRGNFPIFGTCAGIIVLAKKIRGKHIPPSLKLLDITVERNAYGTQIDSFDVPVKSAVLGKKAFLTSFIRAPKITKAARRVTVLATHDGKPALVQQGNILGATFHTEVYDDTRLHAYFLSLS